MVLDDGSEVDGRLLRPRPEHLHPMFALLRERRISMGIARRKLAKKIGTGFSNLDRWERGQSTPHALSFIDWAAALGLVVKLEERE